jgi:hypothetical protein
MLKLKLDHQEEIILKYMVKLTIAEQKMIENSEMIGKIYTLLSTEISDLNESITILTPAQSSHSSDEK